MNSWRLVIEMFWVYKLFFNTELLLFNDPMIFYFMVSKSTSLLTFFYEADYSIRNQGLHKIALPIREAINKWGNEKQCYHSEIHFISRRAMAALCFVNMLCMLTTHVDTMENLPISCWSALEIPGIQTWWNPIPQVSSFNTRDVDEVMEYVRGMTEPVELSIVGRSTAPQMEITGSLQHRRLGYCVIPVQCYKVCRNGEESFYEHTLQRFKPIDIHLNLELRNSIRSEMLNRKSVFHFTTFSIISAFFSRLMGRCFPPIMISLPQWSWSFL